MDKESKFQTPNCFRYFVFCVLLLFPFVLRAQMDQGTITGVVKDNVGAIIAGAHVSLTNTGTGLVLQTVTDNSGIYEFSPIKIGNYTVSASAAGFSSTLQQNLRVDIQERLNVVLVLKPGSVAQTVTVSTAPPILQTQTGSVGQVMETRTINNIPLNGRNSMFVAQLAPGVTQGIGGRGNGTGDFSANGQRPTQNNYILDGIDNNTAAPDFLNGASFVVNPPPDALAEFNVQTSNYSAELGHSAGAVMNTTVKSGTNQIHGDMWEYFRNTALDAKNFNALTIPTYHENQFGATLGLPVIKNRLFFFGYSEANRIVFGNTYTESIPTLKMRSGDFSELLNPALTPQGKAITLYEPGSAGTVPLTCNGQVNVMCPNQINKAASNVLGLFPTPNANGGRLFNNYVVNTNAVSNSWQWGTRFDWNVSSKDQMFVRFSYLNVPGSYPPPLGTVLDGGSYGSDGQIINRGENFAFSETHIFNPLLINELRFGYNYGNFGFVQTSFSDANLAQSLGLGGVPGGVLGGGLPVMSLSGISSFGPPGYYPNHKNEDVYQILDNVTKIWGNHSIKVGFNLQSIRFPFFSPPNGRGVYTFSGFYTSIPGKSFTGYGPADFLLNEMESASIPGYNKLDFSHWYRAAYVQDDWRVTQRLTLNLGVRYDYFQPLEEIKGKFANFSMQSSGPAAAQGVLTYTTSQRGTYLAPQFLNLLTANNVQIRYTGKSSLVNGQKLNFSPRLGFAYSVNDKTVIHGGFGIFYGGLENIGGPETLQNYPFQFTSNFPRPSSCTPGNCATNGISLDTGFTQYLNEGLANLISTPSFAGTQDIKTPYTESYNLSAQRALSTNLVATLGYVGNVGRHLEVDINSNSPAALIDPRLSTQSVQPFPAFGGVSEVVYEGISTYNALQSKLQKRFENGLDFLATYTWARSLDDAAQPLNSGTGGYRAVNLIGIRNDYTNSSFDVRHRLTFNGFYELPFGQGKRFANRGGITNELIGGWASDLEFFAQTGFPISVGTDLGGAGPHGGTAYAILKRDPYAPGGTPDPTNPGISCAQKTRTKQHWYNPCAFANPPLAFPQARVPGSPISKDRIVGLAALPYLGGRRKSIYGPGYERVNMSLFKNFSTFHKQYLQFRADIFNVLNTPAYGNPSVSDNSSNGGQITSPLFLQNLTPDARFFQLSAKYVF